MIASRKIAMKLQRKVFVGAGLFLLTTLVVMQWSADYDPQDRMHANTLRYEERGLDRLVPAVHDTQLVVTSNVSSSSTIDKQQLLSKLLDDIHRSEDLPELIGKDWESNSIRVPTTSDVIRSGSIYRDISGDSASIKSTARTTTTPIPTPTPIPTTTTTATHSPIPTEHATLNPALIGELKTLSDWQAETQKRRQARVAETCAHMETNFERFRDPDWTEMYVDDDRRYIYCLISKASCTSWKSTLLMLTGKVDANKYQRPEHLPVGFVHNHANSDRYINRLATMTYNDRQSRLASYFKFVFVREPFERLVSAYRDKILVDPAYHVRDEIIRLYRPRPLETAIAKTNDTAGSASRATASATNSSTSNELVLPTFTEFVRYVLNQRAMGRKLDRHWIPQNELCRPCRVRYDFIGHQETLQTDAVTVVTRLQSAADPLLARFTAHIRFPPDNGDRRSANYVREMFSQLPANYVRGLMDLYAVDFAMFDYEPSYVLSPTDDRPPNTSPSLAIDAPLLKTRHDSDHSNLHT